MFCHNKPLFRARSEGLGRLVHSVYLTIKIRFINGVDKPNFRVSLPHGRSTTVSLETNPPYLFNN